MANSKGSAQILIDHIHESKDNPVVLTNSDLQKLLGLGNDVYRYQQLRYEIPFLSSDIILERQASNYLRQEKQPMAFKKLNQDEIEQYQLTSINFRHLSDAQIAEINHRLPPNFSYRKDIPGSARKELFRILLIIDIIISKNPENHWCAIAKNLFPSFLAASEDEIQILFDVLLQSKLIYKAQYNGISIFKLALSDTARKEIENFLQTPTDQISNLEVVNVNISRTRPVRLMRKSSKAVKASEGIDLSTKCAIIENKETSVRNDAKTDTFEAALKALSDCYRAKEQQLANILADNKRSHEVFEAMNADYVVKNDELAKLKSEIDDIAQTKKELKQRVPHILDLLVSHLLDALMEYTQAPVSIESTNEFKSKMLSVVMDAQQSIKNVLPK